MKRMGGNEVKLPKKRIMEKQEINMEVGDQVKINKKVKRDRRRFNQSGLSFSYQMINQDLR